MGLKFKNGTILFCLLFSIYSFFSITYFKGLNSQLIRDYAHNYYDWSLLISPAVLFLIISIIFSITTFLIDKNNKNKFPKKNIFIFNLINFFVIYALLIIFGVISDRGEEWFFETLFAIIGGWFPALIIILLFSVIPSIIYYKTKQHESFLRIIMVLGIIVSVLFIICTIISYSTCSLGKNEWCITQKALENNDSNLCEKASKSLEEERVKGNLEIDESYGKNYCYNYFSLYSSLEDNACDKIKPSSFISFENCIIDTARRNTNVELCYKISDKARFNQCITDITTDTGDIKYCEHIKPSDSINEVCVLWSVNNCIFYFDKETCERKAREYSYRKK